MNIKNLFASAGLISLVITTALIVDSAKAAISVRIGGENRYSTASQVAKSNWTSGSENVVLVSGEGYADAVSASVLAKKLDAPILLTRADSLDANAKSALDILRPKNVYIVGGTAAVSKSVESSLSGYTITRLAGENRYDTNIAVANKLVELGVSKDDIIAVAGTGFSDALSVAPIAAAKDEILLLTNNNVDSLTSAVDFAKDSNVTVVGTTNVVSDAVYNALKADNRINGGADRFATNLNVLKAFGDNFKSSKIYVANATGQGYADALVASALAGKYSVPLILTDNERSTATNKAVDYIKTKVTKNTNLQIVGDTGVVSKSVEDKINALFEKNNDNDDNDSSDSSDKSSNKLTDATNAVVKAESSKLQTDVDSAKVLVNALVDSTDKTSLLSRLQVIQKEIDQDGASREALDKATIAVSKAEKSKSQADVDSAKTLVEALSDSSDKDSLLDRLQAVQNEINQINNQQQALAEASDAISKAEASSTIEDYNTAKVLVDALPSSSDKTSLENRLNTVEIIIKSKVYLATAQSTLQQSDLDTAVIQINKLADGTIKDGLLSQADAIQDAIDDLTANQQAVVEATAAVVKAEGSKLQTDYDKAKALVDTLPSSVDKTALEGRLSTLKDIIDNQVTLQQATDAVANTESTKTQSDYDTAKALVDALPDSSNKIALEDRLSTLEGLLSQQDAVNKATTAVEKAENSKLQPDVDSAKALVDALADSPDKTSLQGRLQAVQSEINKANIDKEALDNAAAAVVKAEGSKIQADVDSAKVLVDALVNSSDKTALLNRLQDVQNEIDQAGTSPEELNAATQAVVKAESTEFKVDVDAAKVLVNALPNSMDKTSLSDRLNAIQPIITTHQEFYNAVKNSLQNLDESLDIYVDEGDVYDSSSKYYFLTTIGEIKKNSPDLNAELLRYSYPTSSLPKITQINGITKYKLNITFNYTGTKENMISKRDAVASKVNEIVNSVTNATMTDYQKELALHDYLVNNCHYNYDVAKEIDVKKENNPDIYTAYGVLINGDAVCEGYADAMYRLLKAVGIDSMMVVGTVSSDGGVSYGDHAWNIVKIGGQYYQLDPTWDDPTYFSGPNEPIPGYNDPTHDYFNVTDDFLSQNHTWDKSQYPICDSTEYAYKEI